MAGATTVLLCVIVALLIGAVAYLALQKSAPASAPAAAVATAATLPMTTAVSSPSATSSSGSTAAATPTPTPIQASAGTIVGPGFAMQGTDAKGQPATVTVTSNPAIVSVDPTVTWQTWSVGAGFRFALTSATTTMAFTGPASGSFAATAAWNTGYTKLVIVPPPIEQSLAVISGGGGTSTVLASPSGK
ncbi:hypothetical protein WJX74_005528 [Apatococcus lobatus]|uniref:Bacterial spore germination immunoglobulin-like domain-containing protein n=1 Tax=Apatococcus lobatus TaxID=904363 RepID=A0AAW1Q4H8_9CHLO